MSKAFTKDDESDAPLVVPPRAPLPAGVPNYVTARGMRLLRDELAALEAERARLKSAAPDDPDAAHRLAIATARLGELSARVASATVVDPAAQPHDEVRFGATVTVRSIDGERLGDERRITIVGVDEADAAAGRIAFLAPIARAVLGRRVGDETTLRAAGGEETLEITAIDYEHA